MTFTARHCYKKTLIVFFKRALQTVKSIVGILQSDPVIRRELMYDQILENIITVFNRRKNTPAKLHLSNYNLAYGTSEK